MQSNGEDMNLPFSHQEYYDRQSSFLDQLPVGSVVIIPTNTKKCRSNDTNFPFRANSYMLYLSGWDHPGGIWVADNLDSTWKTSLYVRDNDTKSEIWEGRILGPDFVSKNMPVDSGFSINSFDEDFIQYIHNDNFNYIYFYNLILHIHQSNSYNLRKLHYYNNFHQYNLVILNHLYFLFFQVYSVYLILANFYYLVIYTHTMFPNFLFVIY